MRKICLLVQLVGVLATGALVILLERNAQMGGLVQVNTLIFVSYPLLADVLAFVFMLGGICAYFGSVPKVDCAASRFRITVAVLHLSWALLLGWSIYTCFWRYRQN